MSWLDYDNWDPRRDAARKAEEARQGPPPTPPDYYYQGPIHRPTPTTPTPTPEPDPLTKQQEDQRDDIDANQAERDRIKAARDEYQREYERELAGIGSFLSDLKNNRPSQDPVDYYEQWFADNETWASQWFSQDPDAEQELRNRFKNGDGTSEIYNYVQTTNWYQQTFPNIRRDNGQRRFTEFEYIDYIDRARGLFRQFGLFNKDMEKNAYFAEWVGGDVSIDELNQRLLIWDQVRQSSASVKDAFAVYAGLKVSDTELYGAAMDPDKRKELVKRYRDASLATKLDSDLFLRRTSDRALVRLSEKIQSLEADGLLTETERNNLANVDPQFIFKLSSVISHQVNEDGNQQLLSLPELQESLQQALFASLAVEGGLRLPTQGEIRDYQNKGIGISQARQGFTAYSSHSERLRALLARNSAKQGSASDYLLLRFGGGEGREQSEFTDILRKETARGQAVGNFYSGRIDVSSAGQVGRVSPQRARSFV